LSDKIAVFFNHGSGGSRGYLRKTFGNLSDPLAPKKSVRPDTVAAIPVTAPVAIPSLSPIDESAGESS
jgi:hypothetical protein